MQIEEKGDLILKLMLSNDGPSPAYISVKFGDKTREVKVPPTGSHIQYILVDAGIFTVDYPGFILCGSSRYPNPANTSRAS